MQFHLRNATLGVALWLLASQFRLCAAILPGYIRDLPPESAAARQARHAKVAERRAGTILIAHRGACTLATENTLEAYAAAMDYGADGCEVDIRRAADGVLVMFHDDMLDHLTDGFGKAEDLTCAELLALHPQIVLGTATARTRPPTFAALLTLARQRAMLLHLDVKEPGVDEQVAQMLDAADAWDHVVAINTATTPNLQANPKLKLLRYKMGLYEDRADFDPEKVKAALAKPGQCLILEDPRLAARQLNRIPYQPVPLSSDLFAKWKNSESQFPLPNETNLVASHYLRRLQSRIAPDSVDELLKLLAPDDRTQQSVAWKNPAFERREAERILERAWAAQCLGQIGTKSKRVVAALEFQVQHSGLHPDWMYNGLDAHIAARALARLHAPDCVPVLLGVFQRVNPQLAEVRNPAYTNTPLAWVDWRKGYMISALGQLQCEASKKFLLEYISLTEAAAREISMPQFAEAAKALLQYKLTRSELLMLLRSPHPAVRGTAIMECLDHPSRDRTAALREVAPWALELPRLKP
jgi:hypothetical protein